MPLSERARVEVYLPDLPKQAYQDLLEALDREFAYTFGGATIIRGLDGSYLSRLVRSAPQTKAAWTPYTWDRATRRRRRS